MLTLLKDYTFSVSLYFVGQIRVLVYCAVHCVISAVHFLLLQPALNPAVLSAISAKESILLTYRAVPKKTSTYKQALALDASFSRIFVHSVTQNQNCIHLALFDIRCKQAKYFHFCSHLLRTRITLEYAP